MTISEATPEGKHAWNRFVEKNYPPVGAFMQTWEWGDFQARLGRRVGRYIVTNGGNEIAVFTMAQFSLPMGLAYGYIPRGPVIEKGVSDPGTITELFVTIKEWAAKKFPHLIFLRMEPPVPTFLAELETSGFRFPEYYVQPRHNLTVLLAGTETDIAASFHPSTRSNLHRAEKRGVTVTTKDIVTPADYELFSAMVSDTITRNHGTNAYPSDTYFRMFLETIPPAGAATDPTALTLMAFYGYHGDEPASAHFVLFFGKTATYLYGASRTEHLGSKVDTYLHWAAMREAKRRGFEYYDLGGIDSARWPTLTDFKRQFRGMETHYAGNIDIPIRKGHYKIYSLLKNLKNK
jgi:lipid II:glycine glycyltransferase (peptidoglycan interpeptide bridge formation enzyme)